MLLHREVKSLKENIIIHTTRISIVKIPFLYSMYLFRKLIFLLYGIFPLSLRCIQIFSLETRLYTKWSKSYNILNNACKILSTDNNGQENSND